MHLNSSKPFTENILTNPECFWVFFRDVLHCFTCVSFLLCYMTKASVMGSLMSVSLLPAAMKTGGRGNNGNACRRRQWKCFHEALQLQAWTLLISSGSFFQASECKRERQSAWITDFPKTSSGHWLNFGCLATRGVGSRDCFNLMLHAVLFQILPDLAVII